MFKLFRNLKPMAWMIVVIIILVTGQAVAELYLPEKMSEIIDDGIYIDYEPLYEHLEMEKPSSLSSVDSEKTLKGYDEDTIPVFEMVEGFSTFDLAAAIQEEEGGDITIDFVFRDIPVKDSQQLFDDVMTPFLEGLEPFQLKAFEERDKMATQYGWSQKQIDEWSPSFWDYYYTDADRAQIAEVINALLVFDIHDNYEASKTNKSSIKIEGSDDDITVNSLLNQDPRVDEDAMSNESNRRILTACISRMKHSEHGNLMPIPVDKNGNRLATDKFGRALEQDKLLYVYSDIDGEQVESVKQSYTGRADPMPDYEVIICNSVLGYAYKYVGDKWVDTYRGITDEDAQTLASEYNAKILIDALITKNKHRDEFTEDQVKSITDDVNRMCKWYTEADDHILLANLLNLNNKKPARIIKELAKYYESELDAEGKIVAKTPLKDKANFGSKWKQFWIRIGNYLTLSATGTSKQDFEESVKAGDITNFSIALVEFKTYKDMMLPDGDTTQTDDMAFILKRGGIMLLLTVAACACAILAALLSSKLASEFSSIIRSKVFGKVETFSLIEFDRYSTSSLMTRSTNDVNQIQQVFLLILRTGLIAPITLIGGTIMSIEKSFKMTAVIFYDIPILVIASVMAAKVVYPLFQTIQKKVDKLTLITREGLTGIRVVRAFNKQETENARFSEVNESLTKTAIAVNRWCAVLAPLIAVVMNCSMVGVVWRASVQIANNADIDVGDMMAVIQYMTQIMMALVMLATVFVMFPRATASALRINEVLATEPELQDPENPNKNYTSVGSVKFENVNFKYSAEAENNILSNINFHAEKGKVTAIVGGTGSGKSSVINLIPRFYDVTEGKVLVDGVDVREMTQEELRLKIGFVPQRSVLFSGTIKDNLCYGKENATDEECWEALEIAQSDTFVREKEGQLNARVEQGGGNFSGGQKQRLAIARAIIRKPEVLIFDDSFSALDFRTDKNLRQALKKITGNSATIIVAQRIGTIMDADNIIVLDGGKIVGQGTHEYLIHNCDVYRDIALSQMSEEELGL